MEKLHVEVSEMRKVESGTKTKAYADISVNNAILIKGFRVVDGSKGLFVSTPGKQGSDGKWYNSVFLLDEMTKNEVSQAILSAYQDEQS